MDLSTFYYDWIITSHKNQIHTRECKLIQESVIFIHSQIIGIADRIKQTTDTIIKSMRELSLPKEEMLWLITDSLFDKLFESFEMVLKIKGECECVDKGLRFIITIFYSLFSIFTKTFTQLLDYLSLNIPIKSLSFIREFKTCELRKNLFKMEYSQLQIVNSEIDKLIKISRPLTNLSLEQIKGLYKLK